MKEIGDEIKSLLLLLSFFYIYYASDFFISCINQIKSISIVIGNCCKFNRNIDSTKQT